MFFDRFFRKRDEAAELRDRALIAETQVLLLRDIVEHIPRRRSSDGRAPAREPRSDKASIIAAKAETTQRLMRMQGKAS